MIEYERSTSKRRAIFLIGIIVLFSLAALGFILGTVVWHLYDGSTATDNAGTEGVEQINTDQPTSFSVMPTVLPILNPAGLPSFSPSDSPSTAPTVSPILSPTLNPSLAPTPSPTLIPSLAPTLSNMKERSYDIINVTPHDPAAFTQGLTFYGGSLYESTGLYGESSLRKVDPLTGEVLQIADLSSSYFAEGLTLVPYGSEGKLSLLQLTWQNDVMFIYNLDTFKRKATKSYKTSSSNQGWGVAYSNSFYNRTSNVTHGLLVVSDGSQYLHFFDVTTLKETSKVQVFNPLTGNVIMRLNELEIIGNYVFANIWLDYNVIKIDPITGEAVKFYDFSPSLLPFTLSDNENILNGIAYDSESGDAYVTGKLWKHMIKVRFDP